MHTLVFLHVHACWSVCKLTCMHTLVFSHVHACWSVCKLTCTHLYFHMYMHVGVCVSLHAFMHTLVFSQHTPILEIRFLEQVWKSLPVFSGSAARIDLVLLEILQETKASKIIVKIDMMMFAF